MRFAVAALVISFATSVGFSAEVKFEKKQIKVGGVPLTVEIADTPEKASKGLMFRQHLADGEGMLFVFHGLDQRTFWMKNTFIPLSIGFFDDKRKLVDIQDMEPVKSEMQKDFPIYASKKPAMYALEVPKGWFKKNKIKIGAELSGL